mmetsp:Transcript_20709/g.36999  ORF Transcript_20709/g.36999 Transcript_20709/m.36999 type:complete len:206 (+) Transcript_20709:549-1166(+)
MKSAIKCTNSCLVMAPALWPRSGGFKCGGVGFTAAPAMNLWSPALNAVMLPVPSQTSAFSTMFFKRTPNRKTVLKSIGFGDLIHSFIASFPEYTPPLRVTWVNISSPAKSNQACKRWLKCCCCNLLDSMYAFKEAAACACASGEGPRGIGTALGGGATVGGPCAILGGSVVVGGGAGGGGACGAGGCAAVEVDAFGAGGVGGYPG